MSEKWDDDIAAMNLTPFEKNGLQVYRNYNKAFERAREIKFAEAIDSENADVGKLTSVFEHFLSEDVRFLPVIACAFGDELLKEMFIKWIAGDVPGGPKSLFNQYGPLSSLFHRIQLAHAFDFASADLLIDLDKIRKSRNQIAHFWDIGSLKEFFETGPASTIFAIDGLFGNYPDFAEKLDRLDGAKRFRARLIWLVARLFYETRFY